MIRGPLAQKDYKPQFSGHETFPLRYGWLKKVIDEISSCAQPSKSIFLSDDAIARFGVGKNMVAAMRHWASVTKMISDSTSTPEITITTLGKLLFVEGGRDPYMENPATLWLLHWQLVAFAEKTTWFWTFNHLPSLVFDRDTLVKSLERLAAEHGWNRASESTIRNDVACFVRTYVAQQANASGNDDALESPLIELGLIKAVGKRDGFRLARGAKPSLGPGVFTYALCDFWRRTSSASTLSFETLAHAPGSPGRVFLLDENELVDRLSQLEEISGGMLVWSETAGLKQVFRTVDFKDSLALRFLKMDYGRHRDRKQLNVGR